MRILETRLPVLESGDHLTRNEFHRRYCARPDIKKAELVEGVVFVASPVSRRHGGPHADVMFWLGAYRELHPDIHVYDNATVTLDADNEVQPDACLLRAEPEGPPVPDGSLVPEGPPVPDGSLVPEGPQVDEEGYIVGAPPLVVEVAFSSASYDLHEKLRAYQRNGVQEYIVWRVLDERISWFRLIEGELVEISPDATGVIESTVFPGLRLAVNKLLAGDLAGVRAALMPDPSGA